MATRTFAPVPPHTRSPSGKLDPQSTDSLPWSSFGSLSAAFAPSPESTVARMHEKARECAGRDTVGNVRSVAERTRSRALAAAYARTAALLEELEILRLQTLKKQATAGNGSR